MKLRELNRWHFALASFLLFPVAFLCWERLARVCAVYFIPAQGRYCSAEVTLDWLRQPHAAAFWILAGVVAIPLAALYVLLVFASIHDGWDRGGNGPRRADDPQRN